MRSPRARAGAPATSATLASLRADLLAAEVVAELGTAGVRVVLLKGPSLARWLYETSSDRPYVDCDLLVGPQDHARTEEVLRALGFARMLGDEDTPGWHQPAHRWSRGPNHPSVDLHRTLTGVGAPAERLWEVLTSESEVMTLGETEVEVLGPPARSFHVALHAAQHGARSSQPMNDLQRALEIVQPGTWREAAHLARGVGATGAFAAGLRLAPAGERLAASLRLPVSSSLETALRATTPPAGALGWQHVARTRGLGAKARVVARKLLPTPRFMREWSSLARRGRLGLSAAYIWRPLWVLLQVGPGLAAWLQARRSVKTLTHRARQVGRAE
jgi:Uncharacterised nucleotidyltransferase